MAAAAQAANAAQAADAAQTQDWSCRKQLAKPYIAASEKTNQTLHTLFRENESLVESECVCACVCERESARVCVCERERRKAGSPSLDALLV